MSKLGVFQSKIPVIPVDNFAELRTVEAFSDNQSFLVLGEQTIGSSPVLFYYDSGDTTSVDDNKNVIVNPTTNQRYKKLPVGSESNFLNILTELGSFTIDDTMSNSFIIVLSSVDVTATIAQGSTIGMNCVVVQGDVGTVTFDSNDTILSKEGLTTDGPGSVASIVRYSTNSIYLNGQLV